MKYRHQLIYLSLLSLGLSACGGNTKTLGQLEYEPEQEENVEFEKLSHEQVRQEYKELLDVFEDEQLKENIERRIADVYMIEGTQEQANSNEDSSYYVDAIKAYRNILERYPNSPDNAEVLYQLAKAYDMEGEQDEAQAMLEELVNLHPSYANNAEAYFRLGDIYFGQQHYSKAANAYQAVTELGDSKLKLNAHYMLGWAQYKRSQFRTAATSFAFVLDSLLGTTDNTDQLDKKQAAVADDALHSLSLAIDKIGGADAVASLDKLDQKPYAWLIYEKLGQFYFDKELYEQAAHSYRAFLTANPMHARAPSFHQQIIQTYVDGGFPRQALEEKYKFVDSYGIYSRYYKKLGADNATLARLKTYLDELARHNYAEGLAYGEEIDSLITGNGDKGELDKLKNKQKSSFAKAAEFYGQYLASFPNDERYDEITFLQAEAWFIAGNYEAAIKGYEFVAYSPKGSSAKAHAADAGYAAILAYQKQIDGLAQASDTAKQWQAQAVDSMLRFAKFYHADQRSPGVLTNAAEYMFGLNEYERAIETGVALLDGNDKLDPELSKTALGIVAHSWFKLEDYAQAQKYYQQQRALTADGSEEYRAISERLANSTYKLSEAQLSEDKVDEAIEQLLNIKVWTPDSPVRVVAQYDAASLMLEHQRWHDAITELQELKTLYPEHELAPEFPRKLAYAYRADEQWSEASNAYLWLYQNDADPEIRREALFSAAEMFEQNKDYEAAIEHFRRYAYAYEQPFEVRMEARYKLASIYAQTGDVGKSQYWLRRIVDGDRKAGSQRTERSRWLGAWAHMQYGDYFAGEFERSRLRQPLPTSLAKKQKFMGDAISRYEQSAELGFLEFTTQSSYKIAGLYNELASALHNSPRPQGLSATDLQTYNQVIEQQSAPLKQLAAELYSANVERAWQGLYNEWIQKSFDVLQELNPDRFNKQERLTNYGEEIR
ncbi:tetratricopeptide repeat protein [Agaribacterium haliotis]|uniref:tetratricopeptide repeat protein n=1 Tax=Agaribacterium haliotis TaxID=2013869 RepID=UPI000BB57334|nr:tetratricopeptide repeat protein [Agaribacterium haliotis]